MLVPALVMCMSLGAWAAEDPNQPPQTPDANLVKRAPQPRDANKPVPKPEDAKADADQSGFRWAEAAPWVVGGAGVILAAAGFGFGLYQYRMRRRDERLKAVAQEEGKQEVQDRRIERDTAQAEDRYKNTLAEELGTVRMLGSPDIPSLPVDLLDTFVSLRVSTSWRTDERFDPDKAAAQRDLDRELSPQEVIQEAFRRYRMLLIIGDPGSGKTTLLKYYAMCCLTRDRHKELGFQRAPLPIYFPLREIQFKGKTPLSFPENLARWADRHTLSISNDRFSDWLRSPDVLVLLDGLDEVGDLSRRRKVCKWIADVTAGLSDARFIVTSRWTGYRRSDRVEIGCEHLRADIRDFSSEQQSEFLRKWFVAAGLKELRRKGVEDTALEQTCREQGSRQAQAIVRHLADPKNKALQELAAVPMLLQIIAAIWKERGFRPRTRADLYDAVVKYLLEYRDSYRDLDPLLPAAEALRVLCPACLRMQEEHQGEIDRDAFHEYIRPAIATVSSDVQAKEFCENIRDRAGLIADYGKTAYVFRHKSFREYLAGLELAKRCTRDNDHLGQVVQYVAQDWWEEPLRFFMGDVDDQLFDQFMSAFFRSDVSRDLDQNTQNLLQTLIEDARQRRIDALVRCLNDGRLHDNKKRYIVDCLKTIGTPEALEAVEQFVATAPAGAAVMAATEVTAQARAVGAIRTGAPGLETLFRDLPESFRNPVELNAEYIHIPAGSLVYSVTKKAEAVPDLYFAKHPVTNNRYRRFISYLAGREATLAEMLPVESFSNALLKMAAKEDRFKTYLGSDHRQWAEKLTSRYEREKRFKGDDQPVVGVSWFDAGAYCLWLTMLGRADCPEGEPAVAYRLPKEVEWEWAASGGTRTYPWPADKGGPSDKLANYERSVGATTPVGRYPEGATPQGLMDMAGNVWEWMENWQERHPGVARSLRGGSWGVVEFILRCSARSNVNPDDRNGFIGFRVLCSQS